MLETVRCSSFFAEGSRQQGAPDVSADAAMAAAEPAAAAHAAEMIQSSCIFLWNEEVERLDPFLLHLEEQALMMSRKNRETAGEAAAVDCASDDSFEHKEARVPSSAKQRLNSSSKSSSAGIQQHLTAEAASSSPAAAR
ncbi:hypothetical protein Emed_002145 [Eimeria media]